jgi:hypothetical protein
VRRALVALGALLVAATVGLTVVAATTSVPVLEISSAGRHLVSYFPEQSQLVYSYRQSIYGVTVAEEFVRVSGRLELRRVSAHDDIRAIEYFRWDTPIQQSHNIYATTPPATSVDGLSIQVTRAGEQHVKTVGTSILLLPLFGETVVRVHAERPSLLGALLAGMTW